MDTRLITTGIDNTPANGDSNLPTDALLTFLPLGGTVFDRSGDLLVFHSAAFNLISQDSNGVTDVYLYNRRSGNFFNLTLSLANGGISNEPSQNASISGDGTLVVFESEEGDLTDVRTTNFSDIFLTLNPGESLTTRKLITQDFNGSSYNPAISADGRFVVLETEATNVTASLRDNSDRDIILQNLITGENIWVSQVSGGEGDAGFGDSSKPALSANGTLVVFQSTIPADQLIPGTTDANDDLPDIFLYDARTQELRLVSHSESDDLLSGNFSSFNPTISADGKWIAFESLATNLLPDIVDTFSRQIYLYNVDSDTISLVSQTKDSRIGNDDSVNPALNANGSIVAFASDATNLLEDGEDDNEVRDIFVWERTSKEISQVSVDADGNPGDRDSNNPTVSPDGNQVAFESRATNLAGQVNPDITNIFAHDRLGENPRIKADFNGNGSNDIVYQQTTALTDSQQAKSIFFDPSSREFFVFSPQVNTPGLLASAVGNFDDDDNPEILYYDPDTGRNFLLNPLEGGRWTFLRDSNRSDAILSTPGIVPTTSVDPEGDGNFVVIYRNESNEAFAEGQNLIYDPIARQFSLFNVTEDSPLAAGQLDGDGAAEIIYGDRRTGKYRVLDWENNIFSPLFLDSDQTAPGFLVRGTLNLDETKADWVLFQGEADAQTVAYNPTTGQFDAVLTTTPAFFSLA